MLNHQRSKLTVICGRISCKRSSTRSIYPHYSCHGTVISPSSITSEALKLCPLVGWFCLVMVETKYTQKIAGRVARRNYSTNINHEPLDDFMKHVKLWISLVWNLQCLCHRWGIFFFLRDEGFHEQGPFTWRHPTKPQRSCFPKTQLVYILK